MIIRILVSGLIPSLGDLTIIDCCYYRAADGGIIEDGEREETSRQPPNVSYVLTVYNVLFVFELRNGKSIPKGGSLRDETKRIDWLF